jgi:dTDP-glucose 4,6-dehydratase
VDDLPVPVYGDGLNERDWLHVLDHCRAIDLLIDKADSGQVYNIGGGHPVPNAVLTRRILSLLGKPESLIRHVQDRPGHDRRYSLDTSKLQSLGWTPHVSFDTGLAETVEWYRANEWWWRPIKHEDPAFKQYYQAQYGGREQS